MTLWSVGFSTRTLDELVALLGDAGVRLVVDVRTMPRSRHTPQWNREHAAATLPDRGIAYRHLPVLGGFRKPRPDSPNTGWRSLGFRGYADHMATPGFVRGLDELIRLAAAERAVFACTEALPSRCHRSLIADALTVRGVEVRHLIRGGDEAIPHVLTSFARAEGGVLIYPDPEGLL